MNPTKMKEVLTKLEQQTPRFKPSVTGHLVRVVGLMLEAKGCQAAIGDMCRIETPTQKFLAEVIGFDNDLLFLMPIGDVHGVLPGAKVLPLAEKQEIEVGPELLGRILDGNAQPLDGAGPLGTSHRIPRLSQHVNPLNRRKIDEPLDVGVRSINTLLTVGKGQRLGLFARSGVGKSVLLGMMTKGTEADVVVVCLVGERGREVKEFIEESLGDEGLQRSVVVTSPADTSPLMRIRSCETATFIAEYFRDQGLNVLLLMDSLTRYSQAQREVALAAGEPPATKGYPPSVFARLPRLIERTGQGIDYQGSITAFYTILVEGEIEHDPIADAAKAILDGHILLSRELAETGVYPAIDLEASISRLLPMVTTTQHQEDARSFRQLYSIYQRNRDLIGIGAYVSGSDRKIDHAIDMHPHLLQFLTQGMNDVIDIRESTRLLAAMAQQCRAGMP